MTNKDMKDEVKKMMISVSFNLYFSNDDDEMTTTITATDNSQ